MRLPLFPLSILLLSTTLPAFAQTAQMAQTPPAPRFYVGLGLYSSFYQPLSGQANRSVQLPVQLMAGYQLRPRLAVQVGVAYSGTTGHYFDTGFFYNPTNPKGAFFEYNATNTLRYASVSALARYTLTRKPAHRVQFDALGGFTLEHSNVLNRSTWADSLGGTRNVNSYGYRASRNTLLLTAGLGTRIRLSQRFGLFYDLTLNKALTGPDPHPAPARLTGSSALGLRYRFGRR